MPWRTVLQVGKYYSQYAADSESVETSDPLLKMPVRSTFLPYCAPSIGDEEINEVVETLRSGILSSGPRVRLFEHQFAEYVGSKHAVAVNSCTAALELALAALDIGPGDEVIVPTITFCASANVAEHRGAKPVLVDVSPDFQISPEAAASAITPRTRAILPVHYAGQACDLAPILELARRHGIHVIEDAAHAVGTEYQGKKIGTHGSLTAFSFYPTKNMTTGEGGMLTTNDNELASHLRRLALHGIQRDFRRRAEPNQFWQYDVLEPGYKANMPEMQAAIGIQQLRKLDRFIERRREIACRYAEAFTRIEGLILPDDLANRKHVFHLYTLRVTSPWFDRSRFMAALQAANIGASVHFIPLHRHPYYRKKYRCASSAFPVAETLFRQIVSIPLYPAMSNQDVEDVITAVSDALELVLNRDREGAAAGAD